MGEDSHKSIELVHNRRNFTVPVVHVFERRLPANDLPLAQRRAEDLPVAVEAAHRVDRSLALLEHLHVEVAVQRVRVEQVVVEALVHSEADAVHIGGVGVSAATHANVLLRGDHIVLQARHTCTNHTPRSIATMNNYVVTMHDGSII